MLVKDFSKPDLIFANWKNYAFWYNDGSPGKEYTFPPFTNGNHMIMSHVFGVDVNSLIKVKTAKLHVYQCETGPDTWTT